MPIRRSIYLKLLLLSLISVRCFGQIGFVVDPDGFTNVREKAGFESKVVYKVDTGVVFFITNEYLDLEEEWIEIWIPGNSFSINEVGKQVKSVTGFIHRSRIRPLSSLTEISDPVVSLIFEVKKAELTRDTLLEVYGLDIPLSSSYAVSDLWLQWNDKRIRQPNELYADLYNIFFESGTYTSSGDRFATYLQGGTYFINQQCADGAGYYEIIWVVREGRIVQRLVGWIN